MSEHKTVQTGFADINGGKLYYEVSGDGPALVLAHAGIVDLRMWDEQFLVFVQNYRVIRFDFWGFGKSTIDNDDFAFHEDLYQLLKFLGVEQAHLLGSSLGGRVIIDFALVHPEIVKSLVVVGSGLGGYQFTGDAFSQYIEQIIEAREQDDYKRVCELRIRFWVDGSSREPDQVDSRVIEQVREMLLSQPGKQGEGYLLEPVAIGRLNEIDAPTLIIIGDRDDANIVTIANLLATNIPGAQKNIIPDTAHLPNMEKPEYFNQVVLEFLQSQ